MPAVSDPDLLVGMNTSDDAAVYRLTPELALESGLDVAAWDAERLFHSISVGTYQASMNRPIDRWKKLLKHGTPVFAYVNCSPQTGARQS